METKEFPNWKKKIIWFIKKQYIYIVETCSASIRLLHTTQLQMYPQQALLNRVSVYILDIAYDHIQNVNTKSTEWTTRRKEERKEKRERKKISELRKETHRKLVLVSVHFAIVSAKVKKNYYSKTRRIVSRKKVNDTHTHQNYGELFEQRIRAKDNRSK